MKLQLLLKRSVCFLPSAAFARKENQPVQTPGSSSAWEQLAVNAGTITGRNYHT